MLYSTVMQCGVAVQNEQDIIIKYDNMTASVRPCFR